MTNEQLKLIYATACPVGGYFSIEGLRAVAAVAFEGGAIAARRDLAPKIKVAREEALEELRIPTERMVHAGCNAIVEVAPPQACDSKVIEHVYAAMINESIRFLKARHT